MFNFFRNLIPQNSFIRKYYSILNSFLAYLFFYRKNKLKFIGITGTDGKTTTTEMISFLLRNSGRRVVTISTEEIKFDEEVLTKTKRTTPSPWKLQKIIKMAKKQDYEFVVLEVSSHAISQKRIFGIKFDVAVLTNITSEHLDYHKNVEDYRNTKKQLFTKYLKKDGISVFSENDYCGNKWHKEFKQKNKNSVLISGISEISDYKISNIKNSKNGVSFFVKKNKLNQEYCLPMLGVFNAINSTLASAAVRKFGISVKQSANILKNFKGVKGRMEKINLEQNFNIFVDFALTEIALKNLLETFEDKESFGDIILVFGCTGDHDKEKRPKMGEVAAKYTDKIVVCDDETYMENSQSIIDDIIFGIKKIIKSGSEYENRVREISDRKSAIEYALQIAKKGDTVLVTGMGNLYTRNMGGQELAWNDKAIIQEVLMSLKAIKYKRKIKTLDLKKI